MTRSLGRKVLIQGDLAAVSWGEQILIRALGGRGRYFWYSNCMSARLSALSRAAMSSRERELRSELKQLLANLGLLYLFCLRLSRSIEVAALACLLGAYQAHLGDLYYNTADEGYWYAPGAIYQYDPRSSLITSVAALMSPGFLSSFQV